MRNLKQIQESLNEAKTNTVSISIIGNRNATVKGNPFATANGIEFKSVINGIEADGWFSPLRGGAISGGCDINELTVNNRNVTIASDSYNKSFIMQLSSDDFRNSENPKQKDFQYTGAIYKIRNTKNH